MLEGDWEPQRLVILEFESMERLREWYDSPEYAPLKQLREEVAVSRSSSSSKAYRPENGPRRTTLGRSVNRAR